MMRQETIESQNLVRKYSMEVEKRLPKGSTAHDLGHILSRTSEADPDQFVHPWRKFYEPDQSSFQVEHPATKLIAVEAKKLRLKWVEFRGNCDREDELDLEAYDPSVESIVSMVQNMKMTWESGRKRGKWNKVSAYFHKFCNTLDAHRTLLKILPEGSEYVSIFTGTLNTVIRASVNHEAVAEGLSQALASVSDNIIDCCRSLEIFDTTAMKQKIGDLYSLVFLLLSDVMDWFMKKRRNRFLDSFNENLYKKFEDRIKSINETSATIRNLAAQSSYAEGRATRLYLEELGQDLRAGLEGQARQRAEMEYHASTIARQIEQSRMERLELRKEAGVQFTHLVAELQKLVYGRALAYIQHERPILLASDLPVLNSLTVDSAYGISNTPSMEWIAEDIAINSVHLEDYFHRDRVRLPYDSLGPVPALQQDLFQRLIDWTTETNESSKVLWLDGPPTDADDLENSLTMLASYFVNIAASSGVPTLSCLCELRRGERLRPSNTTLEVQALLCLAYSLVRQMIEILPPKFETYIDLSVTRFAKLDGTESSWADVISVLRDLVALMPDKLCCVIDGLHWIDTAMSERLLRDLLKELRNDKFKLLITTTGRSATLRNEVYAFETVHIDKLDRTQN